MASSFSNLVNNFAEGIYKIKGKYEPNDKNVKLVQLNTNNNCFIEYTNFKDDLV